MAETPNIAFLGVLGHGKTTLLNRLCGSVFPTSAAAASCTRHVQIAYTNTHKMRIIDTPGIESKVEPAVHLAAQKVAMEELPLSAVVVVVKTERTMTRPVENVMDFLGDDHTDLIRVVGTHTDILAGKEGFDEEEYRNLLSGDLSINPGHCFFVGEGDQKAYDKLEDWIKRTLRSSPKTLVIPRERLACVAALASAVRQYDKPIREAENKIRAAQEMATAVVAGQKNDVTDDVLTQLQAATQEEINEAKVKIFEQVADQPTDTQNLVYGRAGLSLSIKLKKFMENTNKMLSWDVANPADPKNCYKRCPNCGAVWIKVQGCDGETTCGKVPEYSSMVPPKLTTKYVDGGEKYHVSMMYGAVEYAADAIPKLLSAVQGARTPAKKSETKSVEVARHFERGCGQKITWNAMPPITDEQKNIIEKEWGNVALVENSLVEDEQREIWQKSVDLQQAKMKADLRKQLGRSGR